MITVNLPDGSKAQFPDGTPPDVMTKAIQAKFPPTDAGPPAGAKPGSREYADWARNQAVAGKTLPQAGPQPQGDIVPDWARAFSENAVNSVPIIGPALHNLRNTVMGPQVGAQMDQIGQQASSSSPIAAGAGSVFGSVAPFVAGGEIPAVAKVLGMDATMPLLARSGAAAASMGAISAGDALTRGDSLPDALKSGAVGAGAGLIAPGLGDLVGKGLDAASQKLAPIFRALGNTDNAAQNVVAKAAATDINSGQRVMTPVDEASAALNGQPIINADRFGTNVQTLARTAANVDPTADAALKNATQDRFLTQSDRATDFIKRITGGNVNDLAAQDAIRQSGKVINKAAYDAAEAAPGAKAIWTPEIRQLFQSPDFIAAVKGAERTGANDAAVNGGKAVRSPFVFDANGTPSLRVNPDGSRALPNLPFWDIVQRNLRTGSEEAYRKGQNLLGSQLKDMRTTLLGSLDTAVPQFQAARQGAAKFFGADDALEAGRNFVTQKTAIPEAKAAVAKFSPAERKLFATGFASSIIDKIGASSDHVNVINSVFGSPASRQQVELALGKPAAAQLEQFTRIEDIMQGTKTAVQGNSSTVKQLIASGLVGGGIGGMMSGWDPKSIASGAVLLSAGRAGARVLGKSIDQKVMTRVAQILSSSDKNEINRLVLNATLSPQLADAIKAIQSGIGTLVRSAAAPAGQLVVGAHP